MLVSITLILQSSLSHQSTDNDDTKAEILVHFNLGVSDFSKIKTKMPARTRKTGEPVAEVTKFGWTIMSLVQKGHANVYLTQSNNHDCEQLYWLDVLR